jgi:hypothetical protein
MSTDLQPGTAPGPGHVLARASIFDFEGTLADMSPYHGLLPGPGSPRAGDLWVLDDYHQATSGAHPIDWVHALARIEAEMGHAVIVVTARDERWRPVTQAWLEAHPIPHIELAMRPAGDQRPDAVVKGDILADLRTRYDVQMAVDDMPSVVRFWKANGVPTVCVPGWPTGWGET